ncbi:MAG: hypothetical protein U0822_08520 [Anaerolineae bacterium]
MMRPPVHAALDGLEAVDVTLDRSIAVDQLERSSNCLIIASNPGHKRSQLTNATRLSSNQPVREIVGTALSKNVFELLSQLVRDANLGLGSA